MVGIGIRQWCTNHMIIIIVLQDVDQMIQICAQVLPRRLPGEEGGGVLFQGWGGALVGVQGPPRHRLLPPQDTRRLQQVFMC